MSDQAGRPFVSPSEGEAGFHERPKKHTRQKSGSKPDGKLGCQTQPHQPPKCPECGSIRVWKDGVRYTRDGIVQRYLCRDCGFRFSEGNNNLRVESNILSQSGEGFKSPSDLIPVSASRVFPVKERLKNLPFKWSENFGSHNRTKVGKDLNSLLDYSRKCRVCVSEEEAKNLATVKPQQEKAGAGATTPDRATIKGKILEHMVWMSNQGYPESTITDRVKKLNILWKRGANLLDPESVKATIAKQNWDPGTKALAVWAYSKFAEINGIVWTPPKYKPTQKIPFVPMETEIDQIIASCGKKTAAFTQVVKETGARSGEVWHLKWIDVDTEHNILRINEPEKGSNPRIFKVSSKLMAMLNALPRTSRRVFGDVLLKHQRKTYYEHVRSLAKKLNNPRLLNITWRSIRHWKGTMEYHKTKDILHVMKTLGHRNIKNTLVYINLENAIFQSQSDEFTVRVAQTPEEIQQLLEVGFEYVCEKDGLLYFRKRK